MASIEHCREAIRIAPRTTCNAAIPPEAMGYDSESIPYLGLQVQLPILPRYRRYVRNSMLRVDAPGMGDMSGSSRIVGFGIVNAGSAYLLHRIAPPSFSQVSIGSLLLLL